MPDRVAAGQDVGGVRPLPEEVAERRQKASGTTPRSSTTGKAPIMNSQLRRMTGAQPASKTRVIIVSMSMPMRRETQKRQPISTDSAGRWS